MKYASIKQYDIANGPGVRVSIFVSGCLHHCHNCFNPETWDENYGDEFTNVQIDEIIEYLKPDYVKGLSLLGGEPLFPNNQKGLIPLLRKVKEIYPNKTIWCYTGYILDKEILPNIEDYTKEMLSYIDVIVDGRFVEKLKNPSLYFRGSSNQRIIDVKETLKNEKIVEIKFEGEKK